MNYQRISNRILTVIMDTTEEWKEIKDFKRYMISNHGRIKNNKGETISLIERTGYLRVSLTDDLGKRHTISVHVLVAKHFLEPSDMAKDQVNHKNGIKDDNNVSNLEWVSRSQNILHAQDTGLMKKHAIPVKQFTLDGTFVREWESATIAERHYNLSKTISNVCRKRNKSAAGFVWEYANEEKEEINDNEVWKKFRDTEYLISSFGRVRDKRGEIKTERVRDNRSEISLRIDGSSNTYQTHRLVAEAFLDNPDHLLQVDHIDKNSLNNHATNLRWISGSDNIRHSQAKKVDQYTLTDDYVRTWDSLTDVALGMNVNIACIVDACKGKQKTSVGYKWKYHL